MLPSLPSPLQEIRCPFWAEAEVRLLIKRDDLISPLIPGNKWRKLRLFVEEAQKNNIKTIVTFGGAYSNHLRAVAGTGKLFNLETIGFVRGEEHSSLNPALQFCKQQGMTLKYINREDYRNIRSPEFIEKIKQQFKNALIIADGGHSPLGSLGASDIISEIKEDYDHIVTACATGTTLAGLSYGLKDYNAKALGISVLKGSSFLFKDTKELLISSLLENYNNWDISLDYHFGGYAKTTQALNSFIDNFERAHSIKLDHVYTGKMFYALYDLLDKGYFKPGEAVIALHTGGFAAKW